MTTLGKILVFIHLGLSLLVAGIAYGVYAHPLAAKDGDHVFRRVTVIRDAAGKEIDKQKSAVAEERLKAQEVTSRLGQATRAAETRGLEARRNLQRVEDQRPRRQQWYADQLKTLETGTDANGQKVTPVALVWREKPGGGLIPMNRKGLKPIMRRNQQNQ